MKKGGSSAKGSSFERDICKRLSLWWTNGVRDDIFWRTAGSGGRATNRAKVGKRTAGGYGDIKADVAIGEALLKVCCFELKRGYKQWGVLDLVDKLANSKPPAVASFWAQAAESAEQAGVANPIVIFKRDKKQTCIIFKERFVAELSKTLGPLRANRIRVLINQTPVFIMLLEDWLAYVTPQAIRSMIR